MSDLDSVAASLVGLLTDEARKPPRVQARLVAEHLDALGLLCEEPEPVPELDGMLVGSGKREDPPTWLRFAATLDDEVPVAVTRNRSHAAMRALGLDPQEVRAYVAEQDFIRVYRWRDRNRAQTMPVLEDPA